MGFFRKQQPAPPTWTNEGGDRGRWTLDLTPELRAVVWWTGNDEGDPAPFTSGIEDVATGKLAPGYRTAPAMTLKAGQGWCDTLCRVGPTENGPA